MRHEHSYSDGQTLRRNRKMRKETERYVEAVLAAHPEFRPQEEAEPYVVEDVIPSESPTEAPPEPERDRVLVLCPDNVLAVIAQLEREAQPPQKGIARLLIKAVAEKHHIPYREIVGEGRQKDVTRARQEAYFIVRRHTELSLNQIAALFKRDHTTVLYGIRRHIALLKGEQYQKPRITEGGADVIAE